MFIAYRKVGGKVYAYLDRSYRDENKNVKKEMTSLGRVLDRERNIFRSRERGVFTFDIKTGKYGPPPEDFEDTTVDRRKKKKEGRERQEERQILNFGDAYFLNGMLEQSGLLNCIKAMELFCQDLFITMIFYYILRHDSCDYAQTWHEGSYACELFPKADPNHQRINEKMKAAGSKECRDKFYQAYFDLTGVPGRGSAIILTCFKVLPYADRLPVTAVSDPDGMIRADLRLVIATDQKNGLPLFIRYIPGGAAACGELQSAAEKLRKQGAQAVCALLDGEYLRCEDFKSLLESNLGFIAEISENDGLYRQVYQEHFTTLKGPQQKVKFNGRELCVKRAVCSLAGRAAYVYLYSQAPAQAEKSELFVANAKCQGEFMLVSSLDPEAKEILQTCYGRGQIRQLFDISDIDGELSPPAVQGEDVLRGHLMICFMASVPCV